MTLPGWYDVADFGAIQNYNPRTGQISDNGTANLAAFQAALVAAAAGASSANKMATVYANGHYYLSGTLALSKSVTLQGNGTVKQITPIPPYYDYRSTPGTVLAFPAETTGILVHSTLDGGSASAEYSCIRDMQIRRVGTPTPSAELGTAGHGIHTKNVIFVQNVTCYGFALHGFYIDSTSRSGICDGSRFDNCNACENGADGFHFEGIDSQVCLISCCTALNNRRWGYYSCSFGNCFVACTGQGNGQTDNGTIPGTGKTMSGNPGMTVTDTTGLAVYDWIKIASMPEVYQIIDIADHAVTLSAPASATVNNAPIYQYWKGTITGGDVKLLMSSVYGLSVNDWVTIDTIDGIYRISDISDRNITLAQPTPPGTNVTMRKIEKLALGRPSLELPHDVHAGGNYCVLNPSDTSVFIGCWNEGEGGADYNRLAQAATIIGGGWHTNAISPDSRAFLQYANIARIAPYRFSHSRGTLPIESTLGTPVGLNDMVAFHWRAGQTDNWQRMQYYTANVSARYWWCIRGNSEYKHMLRFPDKNADGTGKDGSPDGRAPAPWAPNGLFLGDSGSTEKNIRILCAKDGPPLTQRGSANGQTYEAGDTIFAREAASGREGWKCTEAGTNGTLSGVLGAVSVAGTLVVNNAAGLCVGHRLKLTAGGINGAKKITGIEANKVTYEPPGTESHESSFAVAYWRPSFQEFGKLGDLNLRKSFSITKNNATDLKLTEEQGACEIVKVGGNPGGPYSVIGPDIPDKEFTFINRTSSQATFKKTGGTGVVVPGHMGTKIWHNGTDYEQTCPNFPTTY
ncbi:hypothetical protein [Streptomyces sp. NPDC005408]|uniref:hypothetical protein n=1 Tax=Streptomyces sp. NPDC005408 TaxID=3155341 RepID=UPI0033B25461